MTIMLTHPTDNFEFPPIDANGVSTATFGHIDEIITLDGGTLHVTVNDERNRPVDITTWRSASNDPQFSEPELDYTLHLNVDGVTVAMGLPQAAQLARKVCGAVLGMYADQDRNAAFTQAVAA